ncbi:MAG: DUF4406 domain-containing protein [Candidatus Atribacteria bacterium]|nr:DUF4406 domain-containing protein [Candidatus Atribacteria bacterium]
MKNLYVAGRVTGLSRQEAQHNFARGISLLPVNTYSIFNPLVICPADLTKKEAMTLLLPVLLKCDSILILTNHKFSEGTQIELQLARYCGLQILYESNLT